MASVLSFHAAIFKWMKTSLASRGDDFMELEPFHITESSRLPLVSNKISPQLVRQGLHLNHICKEWHVTGTCSNKSHQVGTDHVCAYCKLPDHTIAFCPPWLATTNVSSVASPSSAWLGHQADRDAKFPPSLQSPNQITPTTNNPESSVNILRNSTSVFVQAHWLSPSDKSLPSGQLNLSWGERGWKRITCMLNELRLLTHKQQRFHPRGETLSDLEW